MSSSLTYKCPGCGGYLEFKPDQQRFVCPYCGLAIDEQEMKELAEAKAQAAASGEDEAREQAAAHLRSYHCQACGAEIVTDDTTAATRCYYCHNPVVLGDRLDGAFLPDAVLPFQFDREQALAKFKDYLKRRRFVDHRFFSDDQLDCFNGVYYPYWLGDIEAESVFDGEGVRTNTTVNSRETVITKRYYRVHREGRLFFRSMIRKALNKVDRQLSDGIHPYQLEEMKPFSMSYLSGFLAEKRDIEQSVVRDDILAEAKGYAPELIRRGSKFDSLNGQTTFQPEEPRMRYVLLPAWVLTYKHGEKLYYYMMNGQNGRVCGKLPIDSGKLASWAAGAFAVVTGLMLAGGAMLW